MIRFWSLSLFICSLFLQQVMSVVFADELLEDFEPPVEMNRFSSYPGEDQQSTSWRIDTSHGAESSTQSLYLYGNTWKRYLVSDWNYSITFDSVWKLYLYTPSRASVQGFGISDGTREIRYILQANDAPPESTTWIPTYTGWKNSNTSFVAIKLPVGRDWFDRYPVPSTVQLTYFLFYNDQDLSSGQVYFDQIRDITDSEPTCPNLEILAPTSAPPRVNTSFSSIVTDPDSTTFTYLWDFGDGQQSTTANPIHSFQNVGPYNVLCEVKDQSGLVAQASHHILIGADNNPVISVSFGGDCMLARRYEDADENGVPGDSDGSLILPGDGGSGARQISSQIRRMFSDLRIVNLESPLTDEGSPHPTKSITFRSRPDAIAGISEIGSKLVSLANNHLVDFSDRGLQETLQVLNNPTAYSSHALPGTIQGAGAGMSIFDAALPRTIAIDGLRIGCVGLCSVLGLSANEQPFFMAGYEKPGVLELNSYNIQRAVTECNRIADVTIIMIHGGIEYATTPSQTVADYAKEAIDTGADLVICHHPHVTQGIEIYNGKLIAYSLGNMIFEQKYQNTMQTLMLDTRMDRDGIHLATIVPAYLEKYQPRFIRGDAGYRISEQLLGLSDDLGTTILPDSNIERGLVLLDPSVVEETITSTNHSIPTSYRSSVGSYLSPILSLDSSTFLKSVNSITGTSGSRSLLLGYDRFVFGNCEEEDVDNETLEGIGWSLPGNTSGLISDTTPHQGQYSLRLRRQSSHTSDISIESADRFPIATDKLYALCGYYRLVNAENARAYIKAYYYPYTYTSYLDTEYQVLGPIDGDRNWTYFETYFYAPNSLTNASILFRLSPPDSGDYGYAYFDEIRLVEFTEQANPPLPYTLELPSSYRYIALKTTSTQSSAQMNISKSVYEAADQDSDGLFDFIEDVNGNLLVDPGETDFLEEDSDGDGLDDSEEIRFGMDGFITNPVHADTDSDGYDDFMEYQAGNNPNDHRDHPSGPTATATSTPFFTSTPVIPTQTPQPSFTSTSSPTSTPVITSTGTPNPATTTPTPHASGTQTPIASMTPTPSPADTNPGDPTFTPTPSPTATQAGSDEISLEFQISGNQMPSGDLCWIKLAVNNGMLPKQIDLYALLEVFGSFFSYPSWQIIETGLSFETISLQPEESKDIWIVAEFIMPDVSPSGPFAVYAVCMESGFLDLEHLISNIADVSFSIGS